MARRGQVGRLMAWAEDAGKAKGLFGSSGGWLAIWVLATGYRRIKKMTTPRPEVIREVLGPGEQLVITNYTKADEPAPLPSGKQLAKEAKRAKRAGRRARRATRRDATDPAT